MVWSLLLITMTSIVCWRLFSPPQADSEWVFRSISIWEEEAALEYLQHLWMLKIEEIFRLLEWQGRLYSGVLTGCCIGCDNAVLPLRYHQMQPFLPWFFMIGAQWAVLLHLVWISHSFERLCFLLPYVSVSDISNTWLMSAWSSSA